MTNTNKTTDCPVDGKREAKDKLPLLLHCVWSLYCSGFVWRFFFLFRCYTAVPRPVECKQRDLGNDMPSYCVTGSQARPPSLFSPFGYFSPFFLLFYLLNNLARRSAVAAPFSTHLRYLTAYRSVVAENLSRRYLRKTQRFKSIKS